MIAFLASLKDFADVLIFLIVGLAVGVHYGLDGWVGKLDTTNLGESPRFKNFKLVLGVGLFAFVADLKAVGVQGNKPYDILAYVLGAFIATLVTVVLTASVIFFRHRTLKRQGAYHLDEHYPPITDYIVHGYRYYARKFEEAKQTEGTAKLQEQSAFRDRFLPVYAEQMSYAMVAVQAMCEAQSPQGLDLTIYNLLRIIKGIVLEYQHHDQPQINVNVMVAYSREQLPEPFRFRIKFDYGDRKRYSHYLAITAYADQVGNENFVLPVENVVDKAAASRRSLPGAPLAFVRNKFEVVDDTRKIQYSKSLPADIKKDLTDYFKTKSFRSFGCVPITGAGAIQLGVLVIESDKKWIFGRLDDEKNEMSRLLEPFALLMGNLIATNHKLR